MLPDLVLLALIVLAVMIPLTLILLFRSNQNNRIGQLEERLNTCQVSCARSEAAFVGRAEFEGRLTRIDRSISLVHRRVDQIALKLGLGPEEVTDGA